MKCVAFHSTSKKIENFFGVPKIEDFSQPPITIWYRGKTIFYFNLELIKFYHANFKKY